MKSIIIAIVVMLGGLNAFAASAYLGTETQDVRSVSVDTVTVSGTVNSASVNVATVTVSGTVNTNSTSVNVATVTVSGTVTSSITGTVQTASTNTVVRDASGNAITVTAGALNVAVTASTTSIQAAGGKVITADVKGSTTALNVLNVGQPDLHGKVFVYASSATMVVGSTLTLTGLINVIDMRAFVNDCTFVINSGAPIVVRKNNSNEKNPNYTLANAQVLLSSQSSGARCEVDIEGAN